MAIDKSTEFGESTRLTICDAFTRLTVQLDAKYKDEQLVELTVEYFDQDTKETFHQTCFLDINQCRILRSFLSAATSNASAAE
jgi:hypothetical protein